MNSPSANEFREQLEARIVALLLGETTSFETAEIEEAIAKDPSLAEFHRQMQNTIGLVSEASKKFEPAGQPAAQPRLSPERRAALLAHFRGEPVKPVEVTPGNVVSLPQPEQKRFRWLIPAAAAAGIVVLGAALLLPSLASSRGRSLRYSMARADVSERLSESVAPAESKAPDQDIIHGLGASSAEVAGRKRTDSRSFAGAGRGAASPEAKPAGAEEGISHIVTVNTKTPQEPGGTQTGSKPILSAFNGVAGDYYVDYESLKGKKIEATGRSYLYLPGQNDNSARVDGPEMARGVALLEDRGEKEATDGAKQAGRSDASFEAYRADGTVTGLGWTGTNYDDRNWPKGSGIVGWENLGRTVATSTVAGGNSPYSVTFQNLDPSKRYSFRGTAVRSEGADEGRWTLAHLPPGGTGSGGGQSVALSTPANGASYAYGNGGGGGGGGGGIYMPATQNDPRSGPEGVREGAQQGRGFWFGHDTFTPPFTGQDGKTINSELAKDTAPADRSAGFQPARVPNYAFNAPNKADGFNLDVVDLVIEKPLDAADHWRGGYSVVRPNTPPPAKYGGGAGAGTIPPLPSDNVGAIIGVGFYDDRGTLIKDRDLNTVLAGGGSGVALNRTNGSADGLLSFYGGVTHNSPAKALEVGRAYDHVSPPQGDGAPRTGVSKNDSITATATVGGTLPALGVTFYTNGVATWDVNGTLMAPLPVQLTAPAMRGRPADLPTGPGSPNTPAATTPPYNRFNGYVDFGDQSRINGKGLANKEAGQSSTQAGPKGNLQAGEWQNNISIASDDSTVTGDAVRRNTSYADMRRKLQEAESLKKQGDLEGAAKFYDQAVILGKNVGGPALEELTKSVEGVIETRTKLAQAAQARDEYSEADLQLRRTLSLAGTNQQLLSLKEQNDQKWNSMRRWIPSVETKQIAAEVYTNKGTAAALVMDARFLYENGRLGEAEAKLKLARNLDPENKAAVYYDELLAGRQVAQLSRDREVQAKKMLLQIETNWAETHTLLTIAGTNELPPTEWANRIHGGGTTNVTVSTTVGGSIPVDSLSFYTNTATTANVPLLGRTLVGGDFSSFAPISGRLTDSQTPSTRNGTLTEGAKLNQPLPTPRIVLPGTDNNGDGLVAKARDVDGTVYVNGVEVMRPGPGNKPVGVPADANWAFDPGLGVANGVVILPKPEPPKMAKEEVAGVPKSGFDEDGKIKGAKDGPALANPSGVFPGPGIAPGVPGLNTVPPSSSDSQLTSGLRTNELPTMANPYATNDFVFTSGRRKMIYEQLRQTRLNTVSLDNAPLSEVIKMLAEEAQKQNTDPKHPVNLLLGSTAEPPVAGKALEPATGQPIGGGTASPDLGSIRVRLPALTNVTLEDALEIVTRAAGQPVRYSVEDYAVLFTPKGGGVANETTDELRREAQALEHRIQETLSKAKPDDLSKSGVVNLEEGKPSGGSFFRKLHDAATGQTESAVRFRMEKESPEVVTATGQLAYDPYWLQTEFEKIKSEAVLNKVVEKLDLDKALAEKSGAKEKLSKEQAYKVLSGMIDVRQTRGSDQVEVRVKSDKPEEGARIAKTVAEAYGEHRQQERVEVMKAGLAVLQKELADRQTELTRRQTALATNPPPKEAEPKSGPPAAKIPPPIPQPEINTVENAFSTFSLNVSDVSFKLAAASLDNGAMPDPGSIRVEEFLNAFNYHDPAPLPGRRLAFAWEQAHYPFAHNRDIIRFSVQTAARGREAQKPLNLVILLDNSGSMERADRVQSLREALKVLALKLRSEDRVSVIAFSRTARLWVDGMAGGKPRELLARVLDLNPEGGTNLEEAMTLGYATATKHFIPNGVNRVILLTDGAANLGNVDPDALKKKVVACRQKGIALDCFGVGWEGYNDDLLEMLSRNGDGRYGFINTPEQAGPEFADALAGALNVAACDVKTQVEFNPRRVVSWRQIGYAKHQLTKEQFRDNTVDAAEIAASESGNALYAIEVNPAGSGPVGVVRVRFKVPETGEYLEQEWPLPYQPAGVPSLDKASAGMRLAVSAAAFGEWLSGNPYAAEVNLGALQKYLAGVPQVFAPDPRPARLESMVRQARTMTGK